MRTGPINAYGGPNDCVRGALKYRVRGVWLLRASEYYTLYTIYYILYYYILYIIYYILYIIYYILYIILYILYIIYYILYIIYYILYIIYYIWYIIYYILYIIYYILYIIYYILYIIYYILYVWIFHADCWQGRSSGIGQPLAGLRPAVGVWTCCLKRRFSYARVGTPSTPLCVRPCRLTLEQFQAPPYVVIVE